MMGETAFLKFIKSNKFTLGTTFLATIVLVVTQVVDLDEKTMLRLILGLVLLIAASEIADKFVKLEEIHSSIKEGFSKKMEDEFKHIEREIHYIKEPQPGSVRFLEDKDEIVKTLRSVSDDLEDYIRAAIFNGANSPTELADDLARVIKEKAGRNILFDAAVAVDYDNPPKGITQVIESKYEIYDQAGVAGRVKLQLFNQSPALGIDIIIFDNKHIVFLLRDPTGEAETYRAILLKDVEKAARCLARWFDKEIFPKSNDYWTEKQKLNLPDQNHEDEHWLRKMWKKKSVEKPLKEFPREIQLFPSKRTLYQAAIDTLLDNNEEWYQVYVFALSGFWKRDDDKKVWLEALSEYARSHKQSYLWFAFGLPPIRRKREERPLADVVSDLERSYNLLKLFDGTEKIKFHFYPPVEASIGVGAIIFKRRDRTGLFTLGFAAHTDEEVVDRGLLINAADAFPDALDWLHDKVFQNALKEYNLPLTLAERGLTSPAEGLLEIVSHHYSEEIKDKLCEILGKKGSP